MYAVATAAHCAHCQAELHGDFCPRCSEKHLGHHDYSRAHFAEHTVDTATHFDAQVVRGTWSLLSRPGHMTAEVLRGCRVPWPKPLQPLTILPVLLARFIRLVLQRPIDAVWAATAFRPRYAAEPRGMGLCPVATHLRRPVLAESAVGWGGQRILCLSAMYVYRPFLFAVTYLLV
ncbi:hypothetical protein [Hymenobacter sp. CRA2]|uniref:hypothetical protein n=1 Tax=Hymenobacter sp. CRA2 TaxID=1955620 RepID=UPI00098EB825|nr:hypothetical protein [Hymenobacter sp. CRA2]OON67260.1 hypothetical protein B0919_19230 [Hymenobacter sp. CRA2]